MTLLDTLHHCDTANVSILISPNNMFSDNRLYRQDREKLIQGAEKVISLKSVRRQVVCSVSILLGYVLAPLLMLFY